MSDYAVYKYPLTPTADRDQHGNMVVDVPMPKAHSILRADRQGDTICVWAGVKPDDEIVTQRFTVVPTGSRYDQWSLMYVDTVFMGALVFHVFRTI
jgi:hypothetical protein